MNRQTHRYIPICLALLALSGCGGDSEEAADASPGHSAGPAPTASAENKSPSDAPRKEADDNTAVVTPTSLDSNTPAPTGPVGPTMSPPPPSSGNASAGSIFRPPREALPIVRQSDEREEDDPARLIGFIRVDEWKALISFDGQLEELGEGERCRKGDVSVVSIKPPQVTLERRGTRWKTVLFEQPVVNRSGFGQVFRSGPKVTLGGSGSGGFGSNYNSNNDRGSGFGGNAGQAGGFGAFAPPLGQGNDFPFQGQDSGNQDPNGSMNDPGMMFPPGLPR